MKAGEIALANLQQSDGTMKLRPVLLLKQMPGFGDWLVTGISTQLHQEVKGFDVVLDRAHSDYSRTNLKQPSLIRLSFLTVLPSKVIKGGIGQVNATTLRTVLDNLASFIGE
jgi:mRNA interferase MazF